MGPPKVKNVEIAMVRPEAADVRRLAHLGAISNVALAPVLYLVKIYLEEPLPAMGTGYALYVGNERIPKYTAFLGGIYFKVHDPGLLEAHRGKPIRFSTDMETFADAAANFPANFAPTALTDDIRASLPTMRAALQK